jgi:hypothetical protein
LTVHVQRSTREARRDLALALRATDQNPFISCFAPF